VVKKTLGLELSALTSELKKRYSIKDGLKGVVVVKVDPNSPASDKRIGPGDVIVEVQQEAVEAPDAVLKRVDAVKKDGKKSILMLIANPQGEVRFVALGLE
jgi:serine protease Do